MKTNLKTIAFLFFATITLFSCTPNEEVVTTTAAPANVAPVNGKSFSADEALQPITFRWTASSSRPQTVIYRLKVWQLMQGQNGTQAMRTNQPIVTKDVDNITETTIADLHNGPCKPPYMCDFIWTVEVINPNGTSVGASAITSNPTLFGF